MKTKMYLGVRYGPNHIRLGFVDRDGQIFNAKKIKVHNKTIKMVVPNLTQVLQEYLKECNMLPAAIGIGLPGYINCESGMWMHCLSMGVRTPLPIVAHLEEVFSVPVYIDNDLNAITLAENFFGIGQFCKEFLYVHAGDGVALGIVSNGRLIRGGANCAGEIGLMLVETDAAKLKSKSGGCLEGILSMDEIKSQIDSLQILYPNSALKAFDKELTHDDIFQVASDGDELALRVVSRVIKALGIGLVNSVNLLNPEHIVLEGYICHSTWFINQVKKYVYENGFISAIATLKDISGSTISSDFAPVLGAACLCFMSV